MKGNGNGFATLYRKLYFALLPTAGMRSKYIRKHQKLFHHCNGNGLLWQSRNFPADPEYISIGENVRISSKVIFINHDTIAGMLNYKDKVQTFCSNTGCIEIGNNVCIGTGVIILPNVRIGSNVIIGAGAIVSKDIPDNSVVAGVPAKVIGSFDDPVEKRKALTPQKDVAEAWEKFAKDRD